MALIGRTFIICETARSLAISSLCLHSSYTIYIFHTRTVTVTVTDIPVVMFVASYFMAPGHKHISTAGMFNEEKRGKLVFSLEFGTQKGVLEIIPTAFNLVDREIKKKRQFYHFSNNNHI